MFFMVARSNAGMKKTIASSAVSFVDDLSLADFGDARLTKRLVSIVGRIAAEPSASLPQAMATEAELEGAYRFLNNGRVIADDILAPHFAATAARATEHAIVRLIHDTTECSFAGETERPGLGRTSGNGQGFLAHTTLATTSEATPLPLGVLALETWTRKEKARKPDPKNSGRNGEFVRWESQALVANALLPSTVRCVHIMDREADAYALIVALAGTGFIIRATSDRIVYAVDDPDGASIGGLPEVAARAPVVVSRSVRLSRRSNYRKRATKEHPAREERQVELALSSSTVVLRRTKWMPQDLPPSLTVNVVRVAETNPPADVEPVEWLLITNLPVETTEQIEEVVDHYRGRWLIEEFFKALKTGCGYEARQLESYDALVNVLALCVPVAVQMLLLRTMDRIAPNANATRVLTARQIAVLRSMSHLKIGAHPTVHEALLAVARLGGHLRRNGPPGWLVLARGFHSLQLRTTGWTARDEM
jgi:hypothetical protein